MDTKVKYKLYDYSFLLFLSVFCDGVLMQLNGFREISGLKGREEQSEKKRWTQDMILKDVRQRKTCIEQMVVCSQVYKDLQRKSCCTEGRRQRWRDGGREWTGTEGCGKTTERGTNKLKQARRKSRIEAGSEGEWVRKRGQRERKLAAVEGRMEAWWAG